VAADFISPCQHAEFFIEAESFEKVYILKFIIETAFFQVLFKINDPPGTILECHFNLICTFIACRDHIF